MARKAIATPPPPPPPPAKRTRVKQDPDVTVAQARPVERTHSDQQATVQPAGAAIAVRPTGTSVALADRLKAAALRQREQVAKAPAATANMISFRGGTMTLNDQPIGNELSVIVLAAQFERSYYPGAFVAGEAVVPSCYSRDNVTPDDAAAYKQNPTCKGCQWNEFETAREGPGKACKEGLKLAFIPYDGQPLIGRPEIAQARLSVLNAKLIAADLKSIQRQANIAHTIQAVMTLTCVPDQRSQYRAGLKFEGYAPDDVVAALESMIEQAEELLTSPYPANMAIDPKVAAAKSKPQRTVKNY